MTNKPLQIRQGDVLLQAIDKLPAGCSEIKPDGNRIVLAYGEVTGHAHAIYDHVQPIAAPVSPGSADEIAEAAIARAQSKAKLWIAKNQERYLEVFGGNEPQIVHVAELEETTNTAWLIVDEKGRKIWFCKSWCEFDEAQNKMLPSLPYENLKHEEHGFHATPVGIFQLPTQVEYTPAELRRVAD